MRVQYIHGTHPHTLHLGQGLSCAENQENSAAGGSGGSMESSNSRVAHPWKKACADVRRHMEVRAAMTDTRSSTELGLLHSTPHGEGSPGDTALQAPSASTAYSVWGPSR